MEFSFDKFMKMAAEDPESFEKFRDILIKQAIKDTCPEIQKRLEDVQCRIDMERDTTDSSMENCIRVFDLMVDYLYTEYLPGIQMEMPVKKTES